MTNPPDSLSATVDLPPGNYYATATYGSYAVDSYLLTKSFTVTSQAQTVRLEEKGAKRTAITVDDPGARSDSSAVWMSLPNGDLVGFAGGSRITTYVTTASQPGTTLRVHEVLTKGGSTALKPSPYRYDLTKSWPHPLPATPVAAVKTASLATTTLTVRAPGTNTDGSYGTVPMLGEWTGVYLGTSMRLPATLTEYVTPGVNMSRLVSYGDWQFTLRDRALPAGGAPGETVGAGPLSPTRRSYNDDSRRDGDRLQLFENMTLGDAAGNRGAAFNDRTSMTLRSDGQVLQRSDTGSLVATVPQDERTYQLEQTSGLRSGWSRLATRTRSEWTFTSARNPFSTVLPLMDLGLTASGLDQRNRATTAPVGLTVQPSTRSTGAASRVDQVEWSLDDGATWAPLPLTATATGVEVSMRLPATAAFAALRFTASNNQGGALRRTLLRAFAGPATGGDELVGGTTISNVRVNGGRAVLPGSDLPAEVVTTFTASDPSGIEGAGLRLWHGGFDTPDGIAGADTRCTPVTATTSNCTATAYLWDPPFSLGSNALAGVWRAQVWATAKDGTSLVDRHDAGSLTMKRQTTVSANASPEPVKKGKTITVSGTLTAVDWASWTTKGYPAQPVTLQFKRAKTTMWATVKTVQSDTSGKLKATVTASADGSYRFSYAGGTAVQASASAGDYVDVT